MLTFYGRLPLFLVGTEVRDRPGVEDGKVVVRSVMKIMITLDHMVMDGYKGSQLSMELRWIQDPEKVFGLAEKVAVGQGAEAEKPVEPHP